MPLIPWLMALDMAGHLEAYDYWLYGPAALDDFTAWARGHEEQMGAMARYVAHHPLFAPTPQVNQAFNRPAIEGAIEAGALTHLDLGPR